MSTPLTPATGAIARGGAAGLDGAAGAERWAAAPAAAGAGVGGGGAVADPPTDNVAAGAEGAGVAAATAEGAGILIVGAAVGLGGKLIRTVSFFGCTFAASAGLGGTGSGDGGLVSAIKFLLGTT